MMKENSQLATSRMIVGDRQDKGEREGRLRHCRERIGNCVIQCGSTPAFLFPRVFQRKPVVFWDAGNLQFPSIFRDPTGSGKKRLKLSLAPPEAQQGVLPYGNLRIVFSRKGQDAGHSGRTAQRRPAPAPATRCRTRPAAG